LRWLGTDRLPHGCRAVRKSRLAGCKPSTGCVSVPARWCPYRCRRRPTNRTGATSHPGADRTLHRAAGPEMEMDPQPAQRRPSTRRQPPSAQPPRAGESTIPSRDQSRWQPHPGLSGPSRRARVSPRTLSRPPWRPQSRRSAPRSPVGARRTRRRASPATRSGSVWSPPVRAVRSG
jgi:hypothetical protein